MQPIKLICALGNNDKRYHNTRHNIGFSWIDKLCVKWGLNWHKSQHGSGFITKWHHEDSPIVLFKPGLLMNINGQPIAQCAQYHHINPENILVVYDELDLKVGQIKLKTEGGHGGHNGIRNLIQHTKQNRFYRLRIGIGRPEFEEVGHYVLGKIPPAEHAILDKTIDHSIATIEDLLSNRENQYHQTLAEWSKSNQPED